MPTALQLHVGSSCQLVTSVHSVCDVCTFVVLSLRQCFRAGKLEDVSLNERITMACRACVSEFVKDRTGADGRIGKNIWAQMVKFTGFYQEPWVRALEGGEFGRANGQDMVTLFQYLEFCLTQVVKDNELGALKVRAHRHGQRWHACVCARPPVLCSSRCSPCHMLASAVWSSTSH